MAQEITIQPKGLYSFPSEFSEAPAGALREALNVVIDRESIVTTRRGFATYGSSLGATVTHAGAITSYQNKLIIHKAVTNKLAYDSDGAGTFVEYIGTFGEPSSDHGSRIRFAAASKNLYFTTNDGVKKLDVVTGTPLNAGAPRALGGIGQTTGTAGFMNDDTNVAYRIVWGYRDVNNNLILGVPSERIIVTNSSGGSRNVQLTFQVPASVDTSWFYQVYRSNESADAGVIPDDELFQVYEDNPSSAEITANEITIIDTIPNDLKQAALYTNPSQQGFENAHYRPPFAQDVALYKNHMLYANTRRRHSKDFILIAVSSPVNGYQDVLLTTTVTGASATGLAPATVYTAQITFGVTVINVSINGTSAQTYTDLLSELNSDISSHGEAELVDVGGVSAIRISHTAVGGQSSSVSIADTDLFSSLTDFDEIDTAVPGAPGIKPGDTITFTETSGSARSFTLTAASADNHASGEFKVYDTGTPAQNIEQTAQSLVRALNKYSSNEFIDGFYTSGFDELPGRILIERQDLLDVSVAITSSVGEVFTPILPSSGSTVTTSADNAPNRIYVSLLQQPEHVPLYRTINIGTADKPIVRILASRDGVFVLKEDGIYRIFGEAFENFTVSTLDNTVKILAPNSAVLLANRVYFFSDQGIVAVSESGTPIISRPIENDLLELSSSEYVNFADATFAVGYESDRKYILYTVSESSDAIPTQAFVYNIFTDSWTKWDRTQACGFVNPTDNKLYLSEYNPSGGAIINQERKTFTISDYADEDFTINITAADGSSISVDDVTNIEVGSVLEQGSRRAVVIEIADISTIIINEEDINFEIGAATIYLPITSSIQTIPVSGKNPLMLKHFQEVSFLFSQSDFESIDVSFITDLFEGSTEAVELTLQTPDFAREAGWGTFDWGAGEWGVGEDSDLEPKGVRLRTLIPREVGRGNWINLGLTLSQAFSSFSFNGFGLTMTMTSTRMK